MHQHNRQKIEKFTHDLEMGLTSVKGRKSEILQEIRLDLEAHIERFQESGNTEDQAVDQALEEMGNPYELAHHMQQEIAPFNGPVLTWIRYMAATLVLIWATMILWYFRAWTYGFDPLPFVIIVGFHLPAILLLWPRIVWKQNWLFGAAPACLALLAAVILDFSGTESTTTMSIPLEAAESVPPETSIPLPVETHTPNHRPWLFALALSLVIVALLWAMQQQRQRIRVLAFLVLICAGLELVFQFEEMYFRRDQNRIDALASEYYRQNGSYPLEDMQMSQQNPLTDRQRKAYRPNQGGFQVSWTRPLSPGFSIVYSSTENRIWIRD